MSGVVGKHSVEHHHGECCEWVRKAQGPAFFYFIMMHEPLTHMDYDISIDRIIRKKMGVVLHPTSHFRLRSSPQESAAILTLQGTTMTTVAWTQLMDMVIN